MRCVVSGLEHKKRGGYSFFIQALFRKIPSAHPVGVVANTFRKVCSLLTEYIGLHHFKTHRNTIQKKMAVAQRLNEPTVRIVELYEVLDAVLLV